MKTSGITLPALGLLPMDCGGLSDTRDSTALKVGHIASSAQERQRVDVPLRAGTAVAVGLFFVVGSRKP